MVSIYRNTSDLAADERIAIERIVGSPLTESQRIVVRVLDANEQGEVSPQRTAADYAILSDLDAAEADRLTDAILQRSPGRDLIL